MIKRSNLRKSSTFLIPFPFPWKPFSTHLYRSPPNVLSLVNKGLTLYQWKQDIGAAERCCNEALRIDSSCEAAVATLAQLNLQQSKIEKAVEMFSRQAELARSEPELVNALTYQFVSIFSVIGVSLGSFFCIVLASILLLSMEPVLLFLLGICVPDGPYVTRRRTYLRLTNFFFSFSRLHLPKSNFCVTIPPWPLNYRKWRRV